MATFESLKLRPEILKACRKQGFKEPTPIQAIVVPVVAKGRDAVVEAKTGSGKTLAYGFPILEREPLQVQFPETLVVVPTRELAEQIEAELVRTSGTLARPVALLTGGGGLDRQKRRLDEGVVIAVGTLGRIEELLQRKFLRLDHVRTVVLDEVDELLRGGFSGNLAGLLGQLPRERQTLLFSATIPTEVEAVARQFTRDAARLRVSIEREQPAELSHRALLTNVKERIENLEGYLHAERPYQALIFCGTRHETEEVKLALDELGLEALFLHGELSPLKRRQILDHFRSGDLPVLVASDLAARGLDLPGVDLVVNYSLPQGVAPYLHRAGRTGRAGRPGVVLSLVIPQQKDQYEKLKATFTFESVEISPRGKLFSHPVRTREERDRLFGVRPEREYNTWEPRPEKPKKEPRPERRPEPEAPAKKPGGKKPRPMRPDGKPDRRPAKAGPRPSRPKPPKAAGGRPPRSEGHPDRRRDGGSRKPPRR